MNIDASLVAQLIEQQFPQWRNLPIRAVAHGGWDNRTFHLGNELVVRLPSAEAYAAQVAKEQHWLRILAPQLPLSIPQPIAMGSPDKGYPWPWSVYKWIEGESANAGYIADLTKFAASLGKFLLTLQRIDATDGPIPGPQNFYRGGPLETYDGETHQAIRALGNKIDARQAAAVWHEAIAAPFSGPAVWLHGDVSAGNLLVGDGKLMAVIDFGQLAVGDPACDLSIAWTLLKGQSREVFRRTLPLDQGTWARGRGWALWKALITMAGSDGANKAAARETFDELIADSAT